MYRQLIIVLFFVLINAIYASTPVPSQITTDQSIGFEENKGQLAYDGKPLENVFFKANIAGATVYITNKGLSYYLFTISEENEEEEEREHRLRKRNEEPKTEIEEVEIKWNRVDANLEGAIIKPENIVTENPQQGISNFYYSHCPNGISNVKRYRNITIKNIYPGIDWKIYFVTDDQTKGFKLKYDFVLQPGADINLINIHYTTKGKISVDEAKQFIAVKTKTGTLTEGALYCYQGDQKIKADYSLSEIKKTKGLRNAFAKFNIPNYNKKQILVIDPPVMIYEWGTFFGGNNLDGIQEICINKSTDEFFIGGYTTSNTNFPYLDNSVSYFDGTMSGGGMGNAFVSKFSNTGVQQWCTYYGGTSGEIIWSVSCTSNNVLYAVGHTNSTDFPILASTNGGSFNYATKGSNYDTFILRFGPTGLREWATYFGGNNIEMAKDVYVTPNGSDVYVVGYTNSTDLTTKISGTNSGGSDVFVLHFDNSDNLVWGGHLGGLSNEYAESVLGDGSGNFYVVGQTVSLNYPIVPLAGAYNKGTLVSSAVPFAGDKDDGFITKFNAANNITWSTYYGGTNYDGCTDLSIDPSGNLFVTGWSKSDDFPTVTKTNAYNQSYSGPPSAINSSAGGDAFVLKFTANTFALEWATAYGGTGDEKSQTSSPDALPSITTDPSGNIFIAGETNSNDLPKLDPGNGAYFQGTALGLPDIYLGQFNTADTLLYSTYFGGFSWRSGCPGPNDYARSIATTSEGCLYIVGEWYSTTVNSKPDVNGVAYWHSPANSDSDEGFIMRFCPDIVPLSVLVTSTPPNCYQGTNGTATAAPAGGSPNYTYSWSGTTQTTQTVTGLASGTYTVVITDQDGTTTTATTTITDPLQLTGTWQGNNSTCHQSNGSAEVTSTSGGTPNYTYSWAYNAATTSIISNIPQGTYDVTITDSKGCTKILNVPVGNVGADIQSVTPTDPTCVNTDGQATVTLVNGSVAGTANYSWAPGGQTNATASGLGTGTYTVTVTDSFCTTTATVTLTAPSTFTLTTNSTGATCGANDGQATAMVNGSGTYTYSWSGTTQTTATATGLGAGTYSVTVTDQSGCSQTQVEVISSIGGGTPTMNVLNNVDCYQGTNGSASVSMTGGTPTFTYSWSVGGQTDATATGLSDGTYTVTITDQANCVITQTVTVTQPNDLSTTITPTSANCNQADGSATASATSGGTPTYNYSWSNTQIGATATGLASGPYTLTITDNKGCTKDFTTSISSNGGPNIVLNSSATKDVTCNGGTDGVMAVTVNGGTPNYTYSWSSSSQTTATITNVSAGTQTVSITDGGGCINTYTVTITEPTAITSTLSIINASCGFNNGEASVTNPSGGSGTGFTYSWSSTPISQQTVTGLGQGNYSITVTDSKGCTLLQSFTIFPTQGLSVSYTAKDDTCNLANGSATVSTTGGSGIYTYSWGGTSQTTQTVTGLNAGNYTVTVTDAGGCTNTVTAIVGAISGGVTASLTSNSETCAGNDGSVAIINISGNGPFTYSWSGTSQTTATVTGLSPGNYAVYITDGSGCVSIFPTSVGTAVGFNLTSNSNNASCLTGDGTAVAIPSASGDYTFSWSGLSITDSLATGLNAGTYTVTATDVNMCNQQIVITVGQDPLLDIIVSDDTTITQGESLNLFAGGAVGYVWQPGAYLSCNNCPLPIATPDETITYTITGTDMNGCKDIDTLTIFVKENCTHELFVPTAFSPNNDKNNDVFFVHGTCITDYLLEIFDRWGEKVFTSEDITQGWDGNYQEKPMDAGVFVFILTGADGKGNGVYKKGNVTLVR